MTRGRAGRRGRLARCGGTRRHRQHHGDDADDTLGVVLDAGLPDKAGEALMPELRALYADLPLLLVNPRVPLSTAAMFAAWDGVDRGALAPAGEATAAAIPGAELVVIEGMGHDLPRALWAELTDRIAGHVERTEGRG